MIAIYGRRRLGAAWAILVYRERECLCLGWQAAAAEKCSRRALSSATPSEAWLGWGSLPRRRTGTQPDARGRRSRSRPIGGRGRETGPSLRVRKQPTGRYNPRICRNIGASRRAAAKHRLTAAPTKGICSNRTIGGSSRKRLRLSGRQDDYPLSLWAWSTHTCAIRIALSNNNNNPTYSNRERSSAKTKGKNGSNRPRKGWS
jgi:hypothetical protein